MFTIEQIDDIHERLGNSETLFQYVQALSALGVDHCDSYLTDGHSEYFGVGGYAVKSPAAHETLSIAGTSTKEGLLKHLDLHEQQKTSYLEMSKGLAESGVEKWTIDTRKMTMAYYDKAGKQLLVEVIE